MEVEVTGEPQIGLPGMQVVEDDDVAELGEARSLDSATGREEPRQTCRVTSRFATSGTSPSSETSRYVFLVRHPESVKNVTGALGSAAGREALTARGRDQVAEIVSGFSAVRDVFSCNFVLYSSASLRSQAVAAALATDFGISLITSAVLNSIDAGLATGLTRQESEALVPGYAMHMDLYERGVENGYSFQHPGQPLEEFENAVSAFIHDLEESRAPCVILVGHKSALTAAIIHFARRGHGYPEDFFGYVDIPLASVSVVRLSPSVQGRMTPRILGIGITSKDEVGQVLRDTPARSSSLNVRN